MTSSVVTGKPPMVVPGAKLAVLNKDNTTVTLPLDTLIPGDYQLSLIFKWGGTHQAPVTIPFTVTSP